MAIQLESMRQKYTKAWVATYHSLHEHPDLQQRFLRALWRESAECPDDEGGAMKDAIYEITGAS